MYIYFHSRIAQKPIADAKEVNAEDVGKILNIYSRRHSEDINSGLFADVSMPTKVDIATQIYHAKHSSPGRDGIPFCAWQANIEDAVDTICPVSQSLPDHEPPDGFNDSNVVFAPKGLEQSDNEILTRTPSNLRTIFLNHTDNKIIAGSPNRKLIDPTLTITPINQRGFCPSRQFALNIVVLDIYFKGF